MNKLSKIISIVVIMMMVVAVSISVKAYTNKDVINYVTGTHDVNGRTLQLTTANALRLKAYFEENPVTDEQADKIIAKLDEAKKKLNDAGVHTASQVKAIDGLEAEVVTLIKDAGEIAGLDIQIDTVNEIVTIKVKKTGANLISGVSYRELFGSYKPEEPDDNKNNNTTNNNTTNNNTTNNNTTNKNTTNNNSTSNTTNKNNNTNKTNTTNNQNNTTKKLVYTGNDYSFVIKTIVAIVAIAIVGIVVKKYAK